MKLAISVSVVENVSDFRSDCVEIEVIIMSMKSGIKYTAWRGEIVWGDVCDK